MAKCFWRDRGSRNIARHFPKDHSIDAAIALEVATGPRQEGGGYPRPRLVESGAGMRSENFSWSAPWVEASLNERYADFATAIHKNPLSE
jgi:hypothetical protein